MKSRNHLRKQTSGPLCVAPAGTRHGEKSDCRSIRRHGSPEEAATRRGSGKSAVFVHPIGKFAHAERPTAAENPVAASNAVVDECETDPRLRDRSMIDGFRPNGRATGTRPDQCNEFGQFAEMNIPRLRYLGFIERNSTFPGISSKSRTSHRPCRKESP